MEIEELLKLLEDPAAFVTWQQTLGEAIAERELQGAVRKLMERDGVRAILPVVEKMDDLAARMEEFTV